MLRLIRTSTQRKFLAIMFAALIAVNGPLLITFFIVTKDTLEGEMLAKKRVFLDANSKALSKVLWDFDYENLRKWAGAIANDRDIFSIEILDDNGISLTRVTNSESEHTVPGNDEAFFSKEITHSVDGAEHIVGTLRIRFMSDHISNAAIREVGKSAILFIVSTISVLVAALIANRFMISRPLTRLNAAIEATHRSGTRKKVDWTSSDELGRVTNAFNEMQESLDQDEAQLIKANKRLAFLYNNTPVMLYSIDSKDRIIKVSDYWLHATGYSRKQVIGRKFCEFIHEEFKDDYLTNRGMLSVGKNETLEVTSVFQKADGSRLDVLITETKDFDDSSGGRRSLSVMTDISKLKAAEAKILRQARTDFLTGLLNREGFADRLNAAIENTDGEADIAVLFFDLDRFKWVNDNLGHFAGDRVLQSVTREVAQLLDEGDSFGRFGGDEFAIMLSCESTKKRAVELATKINRTLNRPIDLGGRTLQISASVGISFYPENAKSAEELLKASDVAMYRQKNSGRNGFCVFNEQFGKEAAQQLEVKEIISEALKNDWFELHFQPIVNLKSGAPVGFEGLLRLVHPERGVLPPLEYIRAAEQTGGILEIGDLVLELGLQALERLQSDSRWRSNYVALNFSAAQFLPDLPAKLDGKLSAHSIRPGQLVLEITETTLMQNSMGLDGLIEDIRQLGCAFALDDFGTGFSSLSYMNRFPVDIVKIDRSFINGLDAGNGSERSLKNSALIEAIVGLARKLNLSVIAEGIESQRQLECLIDLGVETGQGFLFGKAAPLDVLLSSESGAQVETSTLPDVEYKNTGFG
ncbi:EAL domain-containing protein [uncultured Roseibium sp.]|uniref:EAL domain-containing protein n=1 Tax=uncultured Roseibium sp. TaxID=1936171 RepID=UPI0026092EEE|nr:EAL domain-containing protein [uncultured Roseibium sp.]